MAKKALVYFFIFLFPWSIRRLVLEKLFKYKIAKSANISRFSLVLPNNLIMEENSSISAFTMVIHLNYLILGNNSLIGRSNWITGFQRDSRQHFSHVENRDPSLIIGKHSAITKHHVIDCTDKITIGDYTTIAGYRSQFLTHSIDYVLARQTCAPIEIGNYCIVGTNSVFLPDSKLPDYSICGANSVVNKKLEKVYCLYVGIPAIERKALEKGSKYFTREIGYID